MDVSAQIHARSLKSRVCAGVQPNRLIASSEVAGWTSLHLDHHEGAGESEVFDTHPTDDVTLVVAIEGVHEVGVLADGRWRSAIYQTGSAGLTPPGHSARLRWRTPSMHRPFETVHLYLPGSLATDLAEEYRRAGQSARVEEMSALVFRDQTVATHAKALLLASQTGEPDIYAASAARWLLTHLLAQHARWNHLADDPRLAGIITDRRLRHVIEYMSGHLAEALTIEDLASEAGISPHHFGRRFREATGVGPARFLKGLRMSQAKLLLRSTDLSVGEVALRCGYLSGSAFATAFLGHTGSTASAYRIA